MPLPVFFEGLVIGVRDGVSEVKEKRTPLIDANKIHRRQAEQVMDVLSLLASIVLGQ